MLKPEIGILLAWTGINRLGGVNHAADLPAVRIQHDFDFGATFDWN
jgi:hypothetical protein